MDIFAKILTITLTLLLALGPMAPVGALGTPAADPDAYDRLQEAFPELGAAERATWVSYRSAQEPTVAAAVDAMVLAFADYSTATKEAFASLGAEDRAALEAALAWMRAGGLDDVLDEVTADAPAPEAVAGLSGSADAVDLASIEAARDRLMATMAMLDGLPSIRSTASDDCFVALLFVVVINRCGTDDTYGYNVALLFDDSGNDRYENNAGGSGILTRNGANCYLLGGAGAGALYDGAGDDHYGGLSDAYGCGANGGAMGGAGLLWDRDGNDVYEARSGGVNGGGYLGTGLLIDDGGNDVYRAGARVLEYDGLNRTYDDAGSYAVNGGAIGLLNVPAHGAILDAGGDDSYVSWIDEVRAPAGNISLTLASDAVNGGAMGLFGSSVSAQIRDASGSDTYRVGAGQVTIHSDRSGSFFGDSVGVAAMAVNGGVVAYGFPSTTTVPANAAAGQISDQGIGDDVYFAGIGKLLVSGERGRVSAAIGAVNGGAVGLYTGEGVALLHDGGGSDTYFAGVESATLSGSRHQVTAASSGINGGALGLGVPALGHLLDEDGDDRYHVGMASLVTTGPWNDVLAAGSGANGGGMLTGQGELIDRAGDDTYLAGILDTTGVAANNNVTDGSDSVNGGGNLGVGLLLDEGGTDVYWDRMGGSGTDRTVVPKGIAGAQIDLE